MRPGSIVESTWQKTDDKLRPAKGILIGYDLHLDNRDNRVMILWENGILSGFSFVQSAKDKYPFRVIEE